VNGQLAFDYQKPRRYHAGHYRPGEAADGKQGD
jgi:hypothetical protein